MSSRWVLTLVLAACNSGGGLTIDASGSTFQKAAQEVWSDVFHRQHREITINYAGGGSGKGRRDFADRTVDFACTDAPFKPTERTPGSFLYIPTVLGAITVSYTLPGDPKLVLSAPAVANIFQRRVTRWNDPAIAATNPNVRLPDLEIVVVRRSDGSGTTDNFTRFLERASGGAWTLGHGSTVTWPAETHAGYGNGGVARIIKTTRGAIGYVDLSDARGSRLTYAAIENHAGRAVEPDPASVTAASLGATIHDDLTFSTVDARSEGAYPITAPSWCMIYTDHRDPATTAAVAAYFRFVLTDGQALLGEIDFAPLPVELRDRALARLTELERGKP